MMLSFKLWSVFALGVTDLLLGCLCWAPTGESRLLKRTPGKGFTRVDLQSITSDIDRLEERAAGQPRDRFGYIKNGKLYRRNTKRLEMTIDNRENLVYNDPEDLSARRQSAFLALADAAEEFKG